MDLSTGGSIEIEGVTEAQLREAFRDDAGRGDFIILGQQPQVFIQAAGAGEGPYFMEYGDGKQFFKSAEQDYSEDEVLDYTKDEVLQAFLWYLAGDSRWQTEYQWQKVEPRPWWKFW